MCIYKMYDASMHLPSLNISQIRGSELFFLTTEDCKNACTKMNQLYEQLVDGLY